MSENSTDGEEIDSGIDRLRCGAVPEIANIAIRAWMEMMRG
ncbi:hypothetical protein [Burkholderia sp. SRS-W-2-2016]|nr:hypothetical protein [Burkholderia sp. SRS-W-2-2016]